MLDVQYLPPAAAFLPKARVIRQCQGVAELQYLTHPRYVQQRLVRSAPALGAIPSAFGHWGGGRGSAVRLRDRRGTTLGSEERRELGAGAGYEYYSILGRENMSNPTCSASSHERSPSPAASS